MNDNTNTASEDRIRELIEKNNIVPRWVWEITVGNRIIHVVRTPQGYKKLRDSQKTIIINDPETGEDVDTGIKDATDENLEDLTPEEQNAVEEKIGRVPSWWEQYLLDHPQDVLLIALIYRTMGGDVELAELIAQLRGEGRSLDEIFLDKRVSERLLLLILASLGAAALAKLFAKLAIAAKTLREVLKYGDEKGYLIVYLFKQKRLTEMQALAALEELRKSMLKRLEELHGKITPEMRKQVEEVINNYMNEIKLKSP